MVEQLYVDLPGGSSFPGVLALIDPIPVLHPSPIHWQKDLPAVEAAIQRVFCTYLSASVGSIPPGRDPVKPGACEFQDQDRTLVPMHCGTWSPWPKPERYFVSTPASTERGMIVDIS